MESIALPTRGALALRGAANILLGVIAYAWPGLTLLVLIFAFALNILITGLFMVFAPLFSNKQSSNNALTVVMGVVSIIVGAWLLAQPAVAAGLFSLLIAFWALLFGILDLYLGFAGANSKTKGMWVLILAGIFALMFGLYMLFNPVEGALSFVWIIGLYGMVNGVFLLVFDAFFYPSGKKS